MENILINKEKIILQALYEKNGDPMGVGELAKAVFINRTTLYPILEKMIRKGLISKFYFEGKIVFQAISVEDLKGLLETRKKKLEDEKNEIINWAESIKKEGGDSLLTEIKYFQGLENVKNLYSDSWRNNKDKMIYAITDYKSAYQGMEKFFKNDYFINRTKRGVKVKNLLPESVEGKKEIIDADKFLREMKFVKIFHDLNIELNIYDSKISIVVFDRKNPSGILIKNEKIAKAFKNIFEYIWGKTK